MITTQGKCRHRGCCAMGFHRPILQQRDLAAWSHIPPSYKYASMSDCAKLCLNERYRSGGCTYSWHATEVLIMDLDLSACCCKPAFSTKSFLSWDSDMLYNKGRKERRDGTRERRMAVGARAPLGGQTRLQKKKKNFTIT